MILLGFIIPAIAFVFEAYPRFLNRSCGVDVWTHLLYLKEFKKKNRIPNEISGNFLVSGQYDYPPAFILILSRFPFRLVEKYEFLFSPFFDSIHLVLIFFLTFAITHNLYFALVVQFIYTVSPIIIIENSSATPRSLGYTLFTITFMSAFAYHGSGNLFFIFLSVVSGVLIFLSHRFTSQGFLFFSIGFSVIFLSPIYIGIFVLSLALTIIFSGRLYLRVLKGHIGNLIFWYKNIKYRFYHQIKGQLTTEKHTDFVFRVYNQFLKFPPFILLITNPWSSIWFYFMFFGLPMDDISMKFVWWITISYILALVTIWIPKLRFLGEGQRYLELSAFPAAFLSTKVFFDWVVIKGNNLVGLIYIIIAGLCLLTIIVIQRKAIIKDTLRSLTPDLLKMFGYLKGLKKKPRLLVFPQQITTNTIYHTGCSVYVNADYAHIQKISEVYPYLKTPIKNVMYKNMLDLVLLNEDFARISDLKLKKYREVKRYGSFVLLELDK